MLQRWGVQDMASLLRKLLPPMSVARAEEYGGEITDWFTDRTADFVASEIARACRGQARSASKAALIKKLRPHVQQCLKDGISRRRIVYGLAAKKACAKLARATLKDYVDEIAQDMRSSVRTKK